MSVYYSAGVKLTVLWNENTLQRAEEPDNLASLPPPNPCEPPEALINPEISIAESRDVTDAGADRSADVVEEVGHGIRAFVEASDMSCSYEDPNIPLEALIEPTVSRVEPYNVTFESGDRSADFLEQAGDVEEADYGLRALDSASDSASLLHEDTSSTNGSVSSATSFAPDMDYGFSSASDFTETIHRIRDTYEDDDLVGGSKFRTLCSFLAMDGWSMKQDPRQMYRSWAPNDPLLTYLTPDAFVLKLIIQATKDEGRLQVLQRLGLLALSKLSRTGETQRGNIRQRAKKNQSVKLKEYYKAGRSWEKAIAACEGMTGIVFILGRDYK